MPIRLDGNWTLPIVMRELRPIGISAEAALTVADANRLRFMLTWAAKRFWFIPSNPFRAVDELLANVAILSAKRGARIGYRVRFPYLRDKQKRRPVKVVIYGGQYERAGRFEKIGIGSIEAPLRIKKANLRGSYGSDANLDDAYVDAVIVNAYSGPGSTTILLDQLSVSGMLPAGDHGRVSSVPSANAPGWDGATDRSQSSAKKLLRMSLAESSASHEQRTLEVSPFPANSVIRILEHQGEPLGWIRSLGFDAVLLKRPPTADLLRDAIRTRMLVLCPPPSAPDPEYCGAVGSGDRLVSGSGRCIGSNTGRRNGSCR